MNINGLSAGFNELKSTDKPRLNQADYSGPNFSASLRSVAQSANLKVADGNSAASLNFRRQKEETLDELFSFSRAADEIVESYLWRIKKLLGELKK